LTGLATESKAMQAIKAIEALPVVVGSVTFIRQEDLN
jgi:hypothetical protein